VHYFHQVDDPYGQLAAQVLPALVERYDVSLVAHLVGPPSDAAAPERERLAAFARRDAADVAPGYGLEFPAGAGSPAPESVASAERVLARALPAKGFVEAADEVGRALWSGGPDALGALAGRLGEAPAGEAAAARADGTALRDRLDTKREAEDAGVAFGRICDPVGRPVERAFSLYPWARSRGRAPELLLSFARAAFAEGVDAGTDAGLRRVVERARLPWQEARSRIDATGWREELEENRRTLLGLGLWGFPASGSPAARSRPTPPGVRTDCGAQSRRSSAARPRHDRGRTPCCAGWPRSGSGDLRSCSTRCSGSGTSDCAVR
jgi:2-hydroxychromene-2-carboxylate isomerase